MNIFEVVKSAFAPFMDGEKPPLHIGEAFNLWYYLTGVEATLKSDQVAYNITQDKELREKLKDLIDNYHLPMRKEIKEFLQKEGVPLPDTTADKVTGVDFREIPEGAKLSDEEIANLLIYNLYLGINLASRGLTESVRSDVGAMFAKFFMMKVTYALTFKPWMQQRGWLRVPPSFKQ